jgi:hypothetical protein
MVDRTMSERQRARLLQPVQQTRKAKHDEVAKLRLSRKEAEADGDDINQRILEVIVQFFSRGALELPSVGSLRAAPEYNVFASQTPDLARYLRAASSDRQEQLAVLRMGISLLYEQLIDSGRPVSSYDLMPSIGRIPALINQAFPGYAESFGLQFLVRPAQMWSTKVECD